MMAAPVQARERYLVFKATDRFQSTLQRPCFPLGPVLVDFSPCRRIIILAVRASRAERVTTPCKKKTHGYRLHFRSL